MALDAERMIRSRRDAGNTSPVAAHGRARRVSGRRIAAFAVHTLPLFTILACAILVPQALATETCDAGNPSSGVAVATPTAAFTDNQDGTITHALTGLVWKRCAEGQGGADCGAGSATSMTWSAALAVAANDTTAGRADWRLPGKKELESIVEDCGHTPAIDLVVFPNAPSLSYWTGSTFVPLPAYAWTVSFDGGSTAGILKSGSAAVRLVRAGRPIDAFDAQSPTPAIADLDVDASAGATKYDALSDGLLVVRYLFGLSGPALTNGALGATALRVDPAGVATYLDTIRGALDIDGNGSADALTDGLLIIRYLFGLRGNALINGAVDPAGTRTTAAAIEAQIQSLMP